MYLRVMDVSIEKQDRIKKEIMRSLFSDEDIAQRIGKR